MQYMQNISDAYTINYYNLNARSYFASTVNADMSDCYERFIKYLKPGDSIIDVGAGSGRDIKFFLKCGFVVEGIDASAELCKLASDYTGISVKCCTMQEWRPEKKYNGIWANASLLHLPLEDINIFIQQLPEKLSDEGVMYLSFKENLCEGIDEFGRYFNGLSFDIINNALSIGKEFSILENWVSKDELSRTKIKWRNIVIGKKKSNGRKKTKS